MDHEGKTERRHKNPGSYLDKETPDVFYISTPDDYFKAQQESTTDMFYAILDDVVVDQDFKLPDKVSHPIKREGN
jgi:hypothetical protein